MRNEIRRQINLAVVAVEFLTRLPVRRWGLLPQQQDGTTWSHSLRYFPLAGTVIGLLTSLVFCVLSCVVPSLLAVLLAIVVELLVTGAFHEDAFADFCDAFGGGWSKEDILRILKDSRLGTYGVAGLTIGLGLRCTALSSLDTFLVVIALFASTTIGRWGMLLVMYWLPSLNEHAGLARQAGPVDRRTLLLGAALSIPGCLPMVWTMPSQWFFAILIVIGGAWCFTGYVGKRLGGLTGDCIGAYGFAAQLLVLLAFHVHWRGLSI